VLGADRPHDLSIEDGERVDTACVDGALVPLAEARIPVTDDGLLRGDGVFEVMRIYDGVPFARELHMQRMALSAKNLHLEIDLAGIGRDIEALLGETRPGNALVRALATRGGHRIVLIEPLPNLPDALTLGYVTYAPVLLLDGVKSLSYGANMLASRLARERGFDEALLVTPEGSVLELPTASFFWVADGEVYTPPLSEHVLDSITRRIVLDVAGAKEQTTTPQQLDSAAEAFVASSVREVIPVRRIEDTELALGPVTERTARAVRAHIAAELSRERER
jgi:branched-chain amino acid aminotransferase